MILLVEKVLFKKTKFSFIELNFKSCIYSFMWKFANHPSHINKCYILQWCNLQAPFNTLTYSLIGDDSTPTFFSVEPNTGLIRLKSNLDLTTDRVSTYVARVVASDGGFPSRSATATVLINVLRNLFSPQFSNANFIQVTILETVPVGSFIADLNATDADKSVSKSLL